MIDYVKILNHSRVSINGLYCNVGLYQDLVIPVTNFNGEEKGLFVLAGDVFDVPIRKDIIHRVVRWQLAKRQQVSTSEFVLSQMPWVDKLGCSELCI